MLATERVEFEQHLGAMFGAWNRVLSSDAKEGYWKGLALMSLSDFARCVGKAIQGYTEDSTQRLPDVGGVWAIKRSLRVTPAVNLERSTGWQGDRWDIAANMHLLAYLQRHARRLCPNGQPDEACAAKVQPFIAAKNKWAKLMRECQDHRGHVDAAEQRDLWESVMEHA